jgi:hypothetical protein
MLTWGYQDRPLALTEFGILLPAEFGYTPAVTRRYLEETFAWLESARDVESGYPLDDYHLVQRWAWFSLSDPDFAVANLADLATGSLTPLGLAFRQYVEER